MRKKQTAWIIQCLTNDEVTSEVPSQPHLTADNWVPSYCITTVLIIKVECLETGR